VLCTIGQNLPPVSYWGAYTLTSCICTIASYILHHKKSNMCRVQKSSQNIWQNRAEVFLKNTSYTAILLPQLDHLHCEKST
jgi:hypothetical protein